MTARASAAVLDVPPAPPLDPARHALFLDFDGTLAPIAPRPEAVRIDPELNARLARLSARLGGRLAVISGRTVADIDRLLGGSVQAIAGVHGLERRGHEGRLVQAPPAPGLAEARAALERFVAERPGTLLEDKSAALALHYRLAPEAAAEARTLAAETARRCGLNLQLGDMVAELKTPGADKGAAVRALMSEPPFAGAVPVFVGDDLTDEHGFEAARELGGFGVLVAAERETAATCRLADVGAVHAWLAAALDA